MPNCYDNDNDLRETLRHNLGKVCSIFTDSGAEFTGVLSEVDKVSCKLIMLHSARDDFRDHCDNARRVHTIPIDKISCLATSQF